MVGGISDPYNPEEREHKLTRNALELLNAFEFGAAIMTKSALVTRDTDILRDIKQHSPVSVNFSITCAYDELRAKVEPFVSNTTQRFQAIEHLAKNGIISGVLMDPIIPYITDTVDNVREMVRKAKHYGAGYMYISQLVTLADVQRDYFYNEAEKISPGITEKYKTKYKNYYRCRSPISKKLWDAFADECEKQGVCYDMRAANRFIRQGYKISVIDFGGDF